MDAPANESDSDEQPGRSTPLLVPFPPVGLTFIRLTNILERRRIMLAASSVYIFVKAMAIVEAFGENAYHKRCVGGMEGGRGVWVCLVVYRLAYCLLFSLSLNGARGAG